MRLGTCLLPEGLTLQGAHPKLAGFCSALVAGYYAAVDSTSLFLDAHQGSNDDALVTRAFQGNATQRWAIAPVSGTHRYVVSQQSNGRFVDAHEAINDNQVVTRTSQGNATQVWIITPLGGKEYTIQQLSNGRFLDAYQNENDNRVVTVVSRKWWKFSGGVLRAF